MAAQPTGTVTLLFTDIEGSTRLLERLGRERYAEALDLHRRLIRGAFERNSGYEVDYEGDAFFAAFPRAEDAVAAASEVQLALAAAEWPAGEEFIAVTEGQYALAARLLGGASGLRDAIKFAATETSKGDLEGPVAEALAAIGEPEFVALESQAREMSLTEAVALALGDAERAAA